LKSCPKDAKTQRFTKTREILEEYLYPGNPGLVKLGVLVPSWRKILLSNRSDMFIRLSKKCPVQK
jgi:hypothetical protein